MSGQTCRQADRRGQSHEGILEASQGTAERSERMLERGRGEKGQGGGGNRKGEGKRKGEGEGAGEVGSPLRPGHLAATGDGMMTYDWMTCYVMT